MHMRLILALVLLFAGCMSQPESLQEEGKVQIIDDLGRNITLEKYPERIVSTAPSNTEIIFALGLGDRVVGVTEYCDYPPETKEKEKIGGFSTVDIEKITSLSPDIIFAAELTGMENIEKLEELGITVVVLQPKDVEGILNDINLVGKITGAVNEAAALESDMRGRIEAVRTKTQSLDKPEVLYIVWHDPLMAAGSGTFISDLVDMAGGVNVAGDMDDYKAVSLEVVVDRDPAVIITTTGMGEQPIYDFVVNDERLSQVSAVKNGRIYKIDQNIVNRAGPRIVDALEEIAGFIHPEA
ncbi:cobalamin-binding protein [archaeon]|nr:cobalamin-binding protein [archaeon]